MSFILQYRPLADKQGGQAHIHLAAMFTSVVAVTTPVITRYSYRLHRGYRAGVIGPGLEEAVLSKSDQSKAERISPDRISEAEHAVMEALWDHGTATASQVCTTVCEPRGWSLATVKTLLSRLVQKGAIETRPDGRRFIYSPLMQRSDYVGGESRRLVDRLFGGRAASLVAHLAETEALTEDDLSEIEALLKEYKS